jgi:hypothetical protein
VKYIFRAWDVFKRFYVMVFVLHASVALHQTLNVQLAAHVRKAAVRWIHQIIKPLHNNFVILLYHTLCDYC